MIHLRIVAPEEPAHRVLELLCASPAVINVVVLHAASKKPQGDVILCDVAREDASVIISDLKELDIPRVVSIAVEHIDTAISDAAMAAEKAAPGLPSDAVVWEEVEGTHLGADRALVQVRPVHDRLVALAVGFPIVALAALATTLFMKWIGEFPENFDETRHPFTDFITDPTFLSFFVAFVAGSVGVLSLTAAKSGGARGSARLGHHDPGGLDHRRCGGLRRMGHRRQAGDAAWTQPRRDRPGRSAHAVRPAALLRQSPAPPPGGPDPNRGRLPSGRSMRGPRKARGLDEASKRP